MTCFKAYDIRGILGQNIDCDIFYRISRAVAVVLKARKIIVGYDARESSPSLAKSIVLGLIEEGVEVLNIGMAGTEEMYWATTEFEACAGIEITASHNPKEYNGLKIVKFGSQPLKEKSEWPLIKSLSEKNVFQENEKKGFEKDISKEARKKYVKKVLSFVNISKLRSMKMVVNCGNGAAGPTFDAIEQELFKEVKNINIKKLFHNPDGSFPNGVPNPIIPENWSVTSEKILEHKADFGIAFDGDFDRCFFFDEKGRFVSGEYIVGLLAEFFLNKSPKEIIVHDPRVIWNIQSTIKEYGGSSFLSKTGHSFIKGAMRANNAIYGGELSAHHYFREFAFCDSGMIPFLLLLQILSENQKSLSQLIDERTEKFISSGEINLIVENHTETVNKVFNFFEKEALEVEYLDGISMTFGNWRFNLRSSNTERLVRLNVETKGKMKLLQRRIKEISKIVLS